MQTADPKNESGAKSAFGYKQTFYEPLVGGGIITALSLPMIHLMGPWNWFILMTVLLIVTVAISTIAIRKARQ